MKLDEPEVVADEISGRVSRMLPELARGNMAPIPHQPRTAALRRIYVSDREQDSDRIFPNADQRPRKGALIRLFWR